MLPEELIEHKKGKLALHPREHPMVLEKERKGSDLGTTPGSSRFESRSKRR